MRFSGEQKVPKSTGRKWGSSCTRYLLRVTGHREPREASKPALAAAALRLLHLTAVPTVLPQVR